jgi:hypothetical protein
MPTISPWEERYTRPALERHTREFKTPDGKEIRLTLEELDDLGFGRVADLHQDLISRYVEAKQPEPLPRGTLQIGRSTCYVIAHLLLMQKPETGETWPAGEWAYTFKDWVGVILHWPETWREIREWANEVLVGELEADAEGEAAPNA